MGLKVYRQDRFLMEAHALMTAMKNVELGTTMHHAIDDFREIQELHRRQTGNVGVSVNTVTYTVEAEKSYYHTPSRYVVKPIGPTKAGQGRNAKCPCGCGKKRKRCPKG